MFVNFCLETKELLNYKQFCVINFACSDLYFNIYKYLIICLKIKPFEIKLCSGYKKIN